MIPDTVLDYLQNLSYRSNPNLRPPNSIISYTQEMIDELIRCKQDPVYFIKNYVKVIHPDRGIVPMELYEYQEKMVRAYHENKRVIFMTARQQGKCLGTNTIVKIRNKTSGQLIELTIGEFYKWQAFKRACSAELLKSMQHLVDSKDK